MGPMNERACVGAFGLGSTLTMVAFLDALPLEPAFSKLKVAVLAPNALLVALLILLCQFGFLKEVDYEAAASFGYYKTTYTDAFVTRGLLVATFLFRNAYLGWKRPGELCSLKVRTHAAVRPFGGWHRASLVHAGYRAKARPAPLSVCGKPVRSVLPSARSGMGRDWIVCVRTRAAVCVP
jgi:hypothetical protein